MREALLQRLLATFRDESEDRLGDMTVALDSLERGSADAPELDRHLEALMRAAHSLKGAARAVGLQHTEAVCQRAESALVRMRERAETPSEHELMHLRALVDCLADLPREPGTAVAGDLDTRLDQALNGLTGVAPGEPAGKNPTTPEPRTSDADTAHESPETAAPGDAPAAQTLTETVRIPAARLARLLGGCEDLLAARIAARAREQDARAAGELIAEWRRRTGSMRTGLQRLRRLSAADQPGTGIDLVALAGVLEATSDLLADLDHDLARLRRSLASDHRVLSSAVDGLMSSAKDLLMLPCASVLSPLPKLARDLARDLGRQVQVEVQGEDIEADRRILEALRDPLVHMVRNAMDHGIEPPEERSTAGKPAAGRLSLRVEREQAGRLMVTVQDDGRGIDPGQVRAAAAQRNELDAATLEAMDDRSIQSLVFRSGLSTSKVITEISGRGLGMAIIADQVERLGGFIEVDSKPGRGTRVSVHVPLELATFRGTVVRAGDQDFVVGTASIQRVIRVAPEQVRHTGDRDTIAFEGGSALLVHLATLLGLEGTSADAAQTRQPALVLGPAQARIVCLVDDVLGEQEITVKGLGPLLRRVPNVAGVAALGSGRMAPLLHVPDLLVTATRTQAAVARAADEGPGKLRSVLVAEDSITARTLLEAILRGAGWRVRTTVDGAEAFAALREEHFDLLISDVEMPRMDGFELTERLRADPALATLPVVLVTARASREDRERGIQAGANAYVVKSDFDQDDLLGIIDQLV